LYRRLGRPQGRSGWVQKILPPPGFDPQTVQPIASWYTYYAIPDQSDTMGMLKLLFQKWNKTEVNKQQLKPVKYKTCTSIVVMYIVNSSENSVD
jgi:hypothetical protein